LYEATSTYYEYIIRVCVIFLGTAFP